MRQYRLKGGHSTTDHRLDRVPQFDERSRAFPITDIVPNTLRSIAWRCRPKLDQGREGSCVGHGWAHELAAVPIEISNVNHALAVNLYHAAQRVDEWPGEKYEGTSNLAGAKVVRSRGYMSEFRWAFGVDDALRAISHAGPVVVSMTWLDSMFGTRDDGLLDCTGKPAGGHCLLVRGLRLYSRLPGVHEPVVRLRNSWGPSWGVNGDAFMRVSDFQRRLRDDGDCCVPIGRHRPRLFTSLRQRLCT